MKKVLSLLLVILIAISLMFVNTFDVLANEIKTGTTGDCNWTLDGTVLTISGNGRMGDYPYSTPGWGRDITKVIINDGVTSIGHSNFYGCSLLTEITIPEGVTSIGDIAFMGCSSLTEITIPKGVTSIGKQAFYSCSSLTEITIPEGVTSIADGTFNNCSSLREIIIPDGVKSIGVIAFSRCNSLTEITIPEGVISIGDAAFYSCSSLSEITIPDSVISIGNEAFDSCKSLSNITIPEDVTNIGGAAFRDCSSLSKITIPNSVTSIGYSAFHCCSSLKEINIPNGVTKIDKYVFAGCRSLSEIIIPDGVTSIGDSAFEGCSLLRKIIIPEGVTSIGKRAFYYCSSLSEITIPDGVTSIADDTFFACHSLTEITIPSGVTSIGSEAFRGCSSLSEITIPNSVTSIGDEAFKNCSSLTEITTPDSVKSIGYSVFEDCSSLKEITIPYGVTSIGAYMFESCSSLKEIAIPEGVTSIGLRAFFACKSLSEITIPNSVISISNRAFYGCGDLETLILPKSLTSVGDEAFYGSNKLKNVWYAGSKEDSKNIAFGTYSQYLTSATWHYNTCDTHYYTGSCDATCENCEWTRTTKTQHVYGDWYTEKEPTPEEVGIKCKACIECGQKITDEIPTVEKLSFKGASLTLHHNLAINYKVNKALFDEVGYTNPYVVFEIGGVETKVTDYSVQGEQYVFTFRNIAPNQMNDTINATLYATYNGVEYASDAREYSVSDYCYSTLSKYSADKYAELRTLLVDLLHYGAQSQLYTKHNVNSLVDAKLTKLQLAWGTAETPTFTNSLNTSYKTVENPLVTWKGASLNLKDSVSMRFKFLANDIKGLSVKITSGKREWTILANNFALENGAYYVQFKGLNAGQMSEKIYLTMYKNGKPVSNTVCYSIESYAYSKQDSTIEHLSDLVKAMMKYGNSAYAYAN